MSEPKIPNEVYKKAAELLDKFPGVDFMNIVRLLVIGRESNAPQCHSLQLGLDEDPEKPTESTPEPCKRRGRPRRRQITDTNGKTTAYACARDMLVMNGIKDTDCIFPHNYSPREDYCALEAKRVFNAFCDVGIDLVEYVCYDFDGKRRSFTMFDTKESEAVNV